MTTVDKTLLKNLLEFGLSREEGTIYIFLHQNPQASSYKLHQVSKLGRGKVESILRSLLDKQLVTESVSANKQKLYVAHPFKSLANLVELKDIESQNMKGALENLLESTKFASAEESSEVFHYTGIDGLKQVLWNALRAKDELLVFEVSRLSAFMQKDFAEKWREEALLRGITTKDLTNQTYMPGWTDVQGFPGVNVIRHIDPDILEIQYELYIYNDVVAMLEYTNNELLCVEIRNKYLATLQRQLFEYIWKDALPMEYIGPRGEAKLVKSRSKLDSLRGL